MDSNGKKSSLSRPSFHLGPSQTARPVNQAILSANQSFSDRASQSSRLSITSTEFDNLPSDLRHRFKRSKVNSEPIRITPSVDPSIYRKSLGMGQPNKQADIDPLDRLPLGARSRSSIAQPVELPKTQSTAPATTSHPPSTFAALPQPPRSILLDASHPREKRKARYHDSPNIPQLLSSQRSISPPQKRQRLASPTVVISPAKPSSNVASLPTRPQVTASVIPCVADVSTDDEMPSKSVDACSNTPRLPRTALTFPQSLQGTRGDQQDSVKAPVGAQNVPTIKDPSQPSSQVIDLTTNKHKTQTPQPKQIKSDTQHAISVASSASQSTSRLKARPTIKPANISGSLAECTECGRYTTSGNLCRYCAYGEPISSRISSTPSLSTHNPPLSESRPNSLVIKPVAHLSAQTKAASNSNRITASDVSEDDEPNEGDSVTESASNIADGHLRHLIVLLGTKSKTPSKAALCLISMALCAAPGHRLSTRGIAQWVQNTIPTYKSTERNIALEKKLAIILSTHRNGETYQFLFRKTEWREGDVRIEGDTRSRAWWAPNQHADYTWTQWDPVKQLPSTQPYIFSPDTDGVPPRLTSGETDADGEAIMHTLMVEQELDQATLDAEPMSDLLTNPQSQLRDLAARPLPKLTTSTKPGYSIRSGTAITAHSNKAPVMLRSCATRSSHGATLTPVSMSRTDSSTSSKASADDLLLETMLLSDTPVKHKTSLNIFDLLPKAPEIKRGAEIRSRKTRKQFFGKPSLHSRLGFRRTTATEDKLNAEATSFRRSAAVESSKRSHITYRFDPMEQLTLEGLITCETFDELWQLPPNPVATLDSAGQLAFREGCNGIRSREILPVGYGS